MPGALGADCEGRRGILVPLFNSLGLYLQDGVWWYTFFHFGVGSALSGVALTSFIFLMSANCRTVRADWLCYIALSSVVPTLLVFFVRCVKQYRTLLLPRSNPMTMLFLCHSLLVYATADLDTLAAFSGIYLILAFFVQVHLNRFSRCLNYEDLTCIALRRSSRHAPRQRFTSPCSKASSPLLSSTACSVSFSQLALL